MLEEATALVSSYSIAIMVGIGMIGVVTATVWTIVVKKHQNPPSAE